MSAALKEKEFEYQQLSEWLNSLSINSGQDQEGKG